MFKSANKKIIEFFKLWWAKDTPEDEITPRQANAIQKTSYIISKKEFEKSCTPPYVAVAAQLGTDKQQVFEAAVFYLCVIAANEPKYKKAILHVLDSYAEEHKKFPSRAEYINNMKIKFKIEDTNL